MKNFFKVVLTSAAALTLASSFVQAQPPSPEDQEYSFRHGLFNVISFKSSQMGAAKTAGDQAAFQEHATDLAYLAGLITEGFQIEGSAPEGSLALPSIWEDFGDFSDKADALQQAALGFAESGDMDSFDPRGFGGQTCGACHREYRARAN